MRPAAVLALSCFVFTLFFTLAPALAAEKDVIKVYYSESIGAGERVFHITACQKKRAYAPLRCSKFNADAYSPQCKPKGTLIEGAVIRGCIDAERSKDAEYPVVNTSGIYNDTQHAGCSDAPDEISSYYVPEYAVVSREDVSVRGTVAWEGDVPAEVVKDTYDGGDDAVVLPLYRPTLCISWDVFADGDKEGKSEVAAQVRSNEISNVFFGEVEAQAQELITAGCNNDNSDQSPDPSFSAHSGPFNDTPAISCSVMERISGSSGVDIFGKYVGALYSWAAGVVGIVAVLTMVFSGIEISMAGGDTAKLDEAKTRIAKCLVGIAILFLSGLILYTINPGFFVG